MTLFPITSISQLRLRSLRKLKSLATKFLLIIHIYICIYNYEYVLSVLRFCTVCAIFLVRPRDSTLPSSKQKSVREKMEVGASHITLLPSLDGINELLVPF